MPSVPKPMLLLAVLAGAGLGLAAASRGEGEPPRTLVATAQSAEAHELSRLRVVHEAIPPVFETYVEPDRLDAEAMFRAALDAIERLVPEVLFVREGSRLAVELGGFRTVVDVPPVRDARALERELRRVAGLVEEHLDPARVPLGGSDLDALAAVEFAMGNGMLSVLDPHSALLPPEASREMDQENQGRFGGLGIDISVDDDRLLVDATLEGSPAARAGVRGGDHIRRIDGQSTINLSVDEAVRLLRGDVGAPVTLEVVHAGASRADELVVVRDHIPIHAVEGWMLAGAVAYVRVPGFHATTHTDLVETLSRLTREEGELRGLVLDLRDNPGGYLREAIAVADTFLTEGEIVSTRGPYDRRPHVEAAREAGTQPDYPMVVLVSASSASASEIVAGALRANQRAVLVGERTFGKGSVQNLHPLPMEGKLKVTIAHYLTPGERSIQSVGVPADIEITPMWVGRPRPGEEPEVALLARERVRREADLDAHLQRPDVRDDDGPLYRLHDLRDPAAPLPPGRGAPVMDRDPELRLAHELLLVAPSAHRGDMLAAAGPLVRRTAAAQDRAITQALAAHGLDWSPGPASLAPAVSVDVSVRGADVLAAGREATVVVEVANTGLQPLHRVLAVAKEHPLLDGAEFPIGKLEPGAVRRWTRTVAVAPDASPAIDPLIVEVRDGSGATLATRRVELETSGPRPPRLAWSWRVEPPADDGRLDPGDVARVELTVQNVGEGPAFGANARLRNRAGKAVDLLTGTLRVGTMVRADGQSCRLLRPGWEAGRVVGDASKAPERVADRLPAEWEEGCVRRLVPGDAWTGTFEVVLTEALADGYPLELTLADRDLGGVMGADHAMLEYVRQDEPIRLHLGAPVVAGPRREAPRVELSMAPAPRVLSDHATLSGRATDADGVAHVVVWVDDEKVEVATSGAAAGVPSLPFTADLRLEPGTHVVTLLVRDTKGDTSQVQRVVHRAGESYTAGVDVE